MKILKDYYKLKDDIRTAFIKYYYKDEEWEKDVYLDYLDDPNEGYWIGWGNVMGIGDIFVDLEDIILIFEHKIPRDIFLDWYWHSVENELDHRKINLKTYASFCKWATHEQIMEDLDKDHAKRQTPEHKAEVEANSKKIWDDGVNELNKHIWPA